MTAPLVRRAPARVDDGRAQAPVDHRRALVLAALALQVAVVAAWAVEAPFELRLPIGLAYAFTVPGLALVGLARIVDPLTELALAVAVSTAAGIAVAQGLVWAGAYSLGTALAVLGVVSVVGLGVQLASRAAPAAGLTRRDPEPGPGPEPGHGRMPLGPTGRGDGATPWSALSHGAPAPSPWEPRSDAPPTSYPRGPWASGPDEEPRPGPDRRSPPHR